MTRLFAAISALTLVAMGLAVAPASGDDDLTIYFPFGPQNDVLVSTVLDGGWEVCYEGSYSSVEPLYGDGGVISELCTGEFLMLAGLTQDNSLEYRTLAAASREDVLFDVGTGSDDYHLANGTRWYFNPIWSWGFVSTTEVPNRTSCDFQRNFTTKTLCWHTAVRNGVESLDEGYLLAGIVDYDATRVILQAGGRPSTALQPVPYTGPSVTNDPATAQSGSTVTYRGSGLNGVLSATIAGQPAAIVSKTASALTLRVPAGLTQGMHDVVLHYSSTESVALQNGLIVQDLMKVWTQLQSDNTVKMYAKNIIGEGKIQFRHNNREIAWVRATNALNPKLRQANGSSYLVRTRALVDGKNAFEIYLDGNRIWRAAYTDR